MVSPVQAPFVSPPVRSCCIQLKFRRKVRQSSSGARNKKGAWPEVEFLEPDAFVRTIAAPIVGHRD
jgi:hypothetical protein